MNILDLTTSEAIRAALGISSASGELIDQTMTDLGVVNLLKLELYSWLPQSIDAIADAAEAETDETAPASLAYLALKAASTYFCAALLLESGEISFAIKHSDGQNEFQRQDKDVQQILERLRGRYADYRQQALTYLESPLVAATGWMIGRSVPGYDPVTNA